ncbi:hypothetical protein ASPZODRAFT_56634 [Penicilliopsis zonata CBS 506.65]|uniref:SH3 domain-containing protein n=1 Tax=Penicilliopsis zonata CBS 506.65 TaxID=1073090 RepID=A0A1L9SUL2_9EURO|nr:hypothetical protein ASPZODRAFT_56634 [Penicilliopsis zonata CBS 506.65]OJJ50804.1 hypothetical protein ASPZODRAFT_56634 [Penicilliopsis zonata CBS 506.65]
MSDTCISLSESTACPAFNASSISTNSTLYADFPFLQYVSNVTDFDTQLRSYVSEAYVKAEYVDLFGCQGVNLTDTADYYARYTTSVICNGIVQSSKSDCHLSTDDSMPLCAATCALKATSEEEIVVNSNLCQNVSSDYMSQVRADFTVCALPADSLTGTCISGSDNEPKNCGYGPNLLGLCQYCDATSTDSCCTAANSTTRCSNVTIPSTTATIQPVIPTSSTSTATADASHSHGLSGGEIAGVVVGSVAGFALLAGLAAFLILCLRRRRRANREIGLNQPNPQRKGMSAMQYVQSPQGYEVVPGGRVARMSALREVPSQSPARSRNSAAVFSSAKYSDTSDSEGYRASPGTMSKRIPPVTGKRNGSLSSNSIFAGIDSDTSPRSGTNGQFSSPEAVTSGQSEQLPFFRDYYSQDDIYAGDQVAVLWAYQPRAGDEFELDRGEMLKVIGIWDDGWATGVRLPERAEDFDAMHREQRDSGVSHGSRRLAVSPAPSGDIKAFPLVCVCLPQHWRKIVEGEVPEEDES